MSLPLISVIIPVYNAAGFLEQCIQSVLNQTIGNFEVLAVDDGSIDESGGILDRLAVKHGRLKVFHTKNQGVSAARNLGLKLAAGEYIGFADADDWLEPEMLEKLYLAMVAGKADWAICNVCVVEGNHQIKKRLCLLDGVIDAANDKQLLMRQFVRFRYDYANWNKLYCSSIIKQNDLHFNEKMSIWEDLLFNLQYLHFANRISILNQPLYNYRVMPTSLYRRLQDGKLNQFNLLYKSYLQWTSQVKNNGEQEVFKNEMARITYYHHLKELEVRVRKKYNSIFSIWQQYYRELKSLDPNIFFYPAKERIGLQGIKKKLLSNGWLKLFALIVTLKPNINFKTNVPYKNPEF